MTDHRESGRGVQAPDQSGPGGDSTSSKWPLSRHTAAPQGGQGHFMAAHTAAQAMDHPCCCTMTHCGPYTIMIRPLCIPSPCHRKWGVGGNIMSLQGTKYSPNLHPLSELYTEVSYVTMQMMVLYPVTRHQTFSPTKDRLKRVLWSERLVTCRLLLV